MMIVIYKQDGTSIHQSAEDAKVELMKEYGEKLGKRAYDAVRNAPVGTRFREYGGPLVCVVDKEKADWIRKKESAIAF